MPPIVIRTLCGFTDTLDAHLPQRLGTLAARLVDAGCTLQTRRACIRGHALDDIAAAYADSGLRLGAGTRTRAQLAAEFTAFLAHDGLALNIACTEPPGPDHVALLFRLIRERPAKTFEFAFTFAHASGSPFFPSADWAGNGFAIGLQATDLATGCATPEAWFERLAAAWHELDTLLADEPGYLGIDASIAPLFADAGSLIGHVRRWCGSFDRAATSDLFLRITACVRDANPRPVGLNGLMLPCLEDFLLAEEYAAGRFDIERNLFLSLHCGLGIDTYPLGIDESPTRVLEVLRLLHGLAQRYAKPLSARFVSDGRARIGEMTHFGNPHLCDVAVRPL